MTQYVFSPGPDTQQSPLAWYNSLQGQPGFIPDPVQERAAQRLDQLYHELITFRQKRQRFLGKWRNQPDLPEGLYLYGGVGRGKSLLMDAFFECVPYRRKRRVHFHYFMQEVHAELRRLKGEVDPLLAVAEHIAKATRLLCFDEFHVSDIADAMILGRLLTALFARGVVFVMTSNYAPDELYPNGLQRVNFLPTIALLKEKLDIINVDGGKDYRLRVLDQARTWLTPLDEQTDRELDSLFTTLAHGPALPPDITVNGRILHSKRHVNGMIWFTFAELCAGLRAQTDYLELAKAYHTIFVSDIVRLQKRDADAARRFTWLIDILYNDRIKLIASSETMPEALYTEGEKANEFFRTCSRLKEMQSAEYLALPYAGED